MTPQESIQMKKLITQLKVVHSWVLVSLKSAKYEEKTAIYDSYLLTGKSQVFAASS